MRSCERVFRRPLGTISRIVQEVGDWAIAHQAKEKPVTCDRIQVDELWSFIGENDRRSALKRKEGGVCWTYLAVDRTTNLVLASHIGLRASSDAVKFFRKLEQRLERTETHEFLIRPTIASDGWKAYRDAAEIVFGERVDFGMYSKVYTKTDKNGEPTPGSRFAGANRLVVTGDPNPRDIITWKVERENGFVRQSNRRFTRKTNGFSKKLTFHERQLALTIFYRNYCWVPRQRKPKDGSKHWNKRIPGAMACGWTEHIWTPEEMIVASDKYIACKAKPQTIEAVSTGAEQAHDFWVVHKPYHEQKATIHKADCSSCKNGLGRLDGASRRTFWHGFPTLELATAFASQTEPDDYKVCKKCLGSYNTLTTYGRRT